MPVKIDMEMPKGCRTCRFCRYYHINHDHYCYLLSFHFTNITDIAIKRDTDF